MISYTIKVLVLRDEEYRAKTIVCDNHLSSFTVVAEYYRDDALHYEVGNENPPKQFVEDLHKCLSAKSHEVWDKLSTL